MTVPSNLNRFSYNGSGNTGPFTIGFPILAETELMVVKLVIATGVETPLTVNAGSNGYTVNAALTEITTTENVAAGEKIVGVRDVPLTQQIDFIANDAFPSERNEEGLDRGIMIAQQLQEQIDRCLKLPLSASSSDISIDDLTGQAGKFARVKATEDGFEYLNVADAGALAVSPFMETVLDDADASTALTTLGFSTFIKTLIDDADASTALSTLGFSAFGKTLIDDADAAAAQTTLGGTTVGKALFTAADAAAGRTAISAAATTDIREKLTTNRTYYVRTDGNDSNTGLVNSSGGALATLQAAVNKCYGLDFNNFQVLIKMGNTGTFNAGFSVSGKFVGQTSEASLVFEGDTTTPANCQINISGGGRCMQALSGAQFTVQGWKLLGTGGINGVTGLEALGQGSYVNVNGLMEYGVLGFALAAISQGRINIQSQNYTISGNQYYHMSANEQGVIINRNNTVTLTGTPAWGGVMASATRLALIQAFSQTYSGAATGVRYSGDNLSNIFTNSGGANYFPGNSAGSVTTGAIYS